MKDFLRYIGIYYSMEVVKLPERHMYWSDEVNGIFPAMGYGEYLSQRRFDKINRYLQLSDANNPDVQVMDFLHQVNLCLQEAIMPGDVVTIEYD